MKYTPLDNIGLAQRDADGNLTNILEAGNNYPASDSGLPKSTFVSSDLNNIILSGLYPGNTAKYPLLDPVKENVIPIQNTNFRFIINLGSTKSYTSSGLYEDLIKAYEERNPWFSVRTVPNINLDLSYLTQYNLINKFKITEAYAETEIIYTLNDEDVIMRYIDWLVSREAVDIELKPIEELGAWEYVPDGDLGIGLKSLYDSMIKDDNPPKEAIGAEIIRQEYSLDLPSVMEVSGFLQPLPDEEIVPKLVEAILSERVPPGRKTYSFFGGGVFGTLAQIGVGLAVGLLAATGVGALAAAGIGAAVAGLSQQGISKIQQALGKFKGSWLEFILARSSDRGLFEDKNKVFNREKDADTKEWDSLLIAARGQMGVTQYTQNHVKDALKIIFSQIGGDVKANDLSYPIKVGGSTKRMFVNPTSDRKVNITVR